MYCFVCDISCCFSSLISTGSRIRLCNCKETLILSCIIVSQDSVARNIIYKLLGSWPGLICWLDYSAASAYIHPTYCWVGLDLKSMKCTIDEGIARGKDRWIEHSGVWSSFGWSWYRWAFMKVRAEVEGLLYWLCFLSPLSYKVTCNLVVSECGCNSKFSAVFLSAASVFALSHGDKKLLLPQLFSCLGTYTGRYDDIRVLLHTHRHTLIAALMIAWITALSFSLLWHSL